MHDPTDPVGRLLFNVLAMVGQLEELFSITRSTVYRAIERDRATWPPVDAPVPVHT